MKVLLSAYACEPDKGSEPEVGFQAMLAAATEHEVWVLTRENNLKALAAATDRLGLRERVHLVGLDVPGRLMRLKHGGKGWLHLYYDRWQREAGRIASDLHRRIRFDVVHHATFAAYWNRAGAAVVDAPLVWGPLGGGVRAPLRLATLLGPRGLLEDAGRELVRRGSHHLSPWLRRARRDARVVLVQNPATARRIGVDAARVRVSPNSLAVAPLIRPDPSVRRRNREIVHVGRLIPWKAGVLAVRALERVTTTGASLHILGDGPDRARVETLARRLGLEDRVVFHGRIDRPRLLAKVNEAGVLLHTALHDESPLTLAEALTLGTPVVCLDHGGPGVIIRRWPAALSEGVPVGSAAATAQGLAEGVDHFLARPPPLPVDAVQPSTSFAAEMLAAYRLAASSP